ncbi:MAG: hypothetical protein FWG12_01245 [Holophagaceae bacterium]|nr:hypothetical protein [Holophagaceae bacterium]
MKTMRLMTAALIASSISSAALRAQEEVEPLFKPFLTFGACLAQGHAHDMTQKTWGGIGSYNIEAGFEFKYPYGNNVKVRPNFGVARLMADKPTEENPDIYDLHGWYVGFDLVFAPFQQRLPNLSLSTGPSFHSWNVEKVDAVFPDEPNQHDKHIKLGWRLGASYRINEQFRVNLTFTQTEWRTIATPPGPATIHIVGYNPSRPAYFTLSGTYSF